MTNMLRDFEKLLPVASSFFALYAAVGALMPFHILYLMSSGITASEQGVITGITPLFATISAPLIGAIADKTKAHRQVTIVCLMLCALSFSLFLAVPVNPPTNASLNGTSLDSFNATSSSLDLNYTSLNSSLKPIQNLPSGTQTEPRRFTFEISGSLQFWSFFVLRVAGFVFFLPASTLPNAMALTVVSDDPEKFSACRAAGSAGFLVWVVLQSVVNEFTTPPSFLAHAKKVNFFVVIIMFDVFMVATAVAVWFYDLKNPIPPSDKKANQTDQENGKIHDDTALDPLYIENKKVSEDTKTDLNETETKEDEQNASLISGLKVVFCNMELCAMLFVVASTGLLWTVHECYIFWYVDEMPIAAPAIFWGPALAATVVSEVPAVFFSGFLIKRIGEVRCILIVLVAYVVRFAVNGLIRSPWYILITQPLHGITFGLNMVAFTTFFGSRSHVAMVPRCRV